MHLGKPLKSNLHIPCTQSIELSRGQSFARFSQFTPMYPFMQVQINPLGVTEQSPPCKQGLLMQAPRSINGVLSVVISIEPTVKETLAKRTSKVNNNAILLPHFY